MLKFHRYDQDGSLIDIESPMLMNFGLTEVAIPAIAGLLTSVGVGAGTAGTIAGIAAPTLIHAGLGAGLGALTGQPGTGALMGALTGGLGPLGSALGLGGDAGQAASGMAGALGSGVAGQNLAGSAPSAADQSALGIGAGNSAGSSPGAGSSMPQTGGSMGGSPLAQMSSNAASGLNGPLAILAALAQNANRPSTTAPTPPGFTTPFAPTGYIDRTPTPGYTPASGNWYTYGQSANPQFFSGNQIHFARGGALSHAFETGGGTHYLHGDDGGQDDSRDAKLSDGEFVMDAGTVSKLGDGNSNAGAKRMEYIRHAIDEDTDSRGVVQRKAKPPLHYAQMARAA